MNTHIFLSVEIYLGKIPECKETEVITYQRAGWGWVHLELLRFVP